MGEAISSEMGMEQTPGSGGTCTLAPEACSPRAGSGSSSPAPLLRPGAARRRHLSPSWFPSSRGSPHWDVAWDHHPPSAGSRRWGPARVPSLQPVPTLIPPAPLEARPASGEGQPARPPTSLRCRECPEVMGGGGLGSHAL